MKRDDGMELIMAGQKNNLLRSVFNAITEPVFILDRGGIILYGNLAMANHFGVEIEALLGENIYEFFAPHIAAERRAQVERVFCAKSPLRYDDIHSEGIFHVSVYPVENEIGDVTMVVIFLHDITELRNRETELRHSEEQLRLLFENSLDGIFLTKPDGKITAANPAACRMLGMTEAEITVSGRDKVFDTTDSSLRTFLQRRDSAGKCRGELKLRRKDGLVFPVELTLAIFKDSKENLNSYAIFRDITERKQLEAKIYYQAFHDSLTGLPNRRLLDAQANLAIALAERHGHCLGVAFLDLDGMKRINDTMGHEAGDILLKEVSRRLSATIRQSDAVARMYQESECLSEEMVARLGGDEFIFLLPQIERSGDMEAFARRILQRLRAPLTIKGKEALITASIGISLYPDNGADIETLIKKADSAMYAAKAAGGNRFHWCE